MLEMLDCFWEEDWKRKLYLVLIRPQLEYCVLLWASEQKGVNWLEQVQLRATRMVGAQWGRGPENGQQRDLDLLSLGERQPRGPHSSHCLLGSCEEMPPAALRRCKARGGEKKGVNWERAGFCLTQKNEFYYDSQALDQRCHVVSILGWDQIRGSPGQRGMNPDPGLPCVSGWIGWMISQSPFQPERLWSWVRTAEERETVSKGWTKWPSKTYVPF